MHVSRCTILNSYIINFNFFFHFIPLADFISRAATTHASDGPGNNVWIFGLI